MFIFIYIAPYPVFQNMALILKLEPDRHAKLHKFIPNHASITHPIDQYHSPLRDEENNGGHVNWRRTWYHGHSIWK
uniref:Putative ovule protein n=1 Tax=Solanum chacoense TaxID=4108 RepID=A0A0V0GUM0_SOLCH